MLSIPFFYRCFTKKGSIVTELMTWRIWLLGGMSLLTITLITLTPIRSLDWWYVAYIASFFVNSPHFAVSYLFYYRRWQQGEEIPVKRFLVGVGIPSILIGVCAWSLWSESAMGLIALYLTMTILVGLHYVKQGFGIFIFESAQRRVFLSSRDRSLLLLAMYSLWIGSLMIVWSASVRLLNWYGLEVPTISLGEGWQIIGYGLLIVSLVLSCLVLAKNYFRGRYFAPSGIIALLIQYVWIAPVGWIPEVLFVIPFFHSLQYLLLAKNAVDRIDPPTKETAHSSRWLRWWGLAFVLGLAGFEVLPKLLDDVITVAWQPAFYLISFILVINIHHYFIDGVVWSKKSKMVIS